jgi:hypothetical protein
MSSQMFANTITHFHPPYSAASGAQTHSAGDHSPDLSMDDRAPALSLDRWGGGGGPQSAARAPAASDRAQGFTAPPARGRGPLRGLLRGLLLRAGADGVDPFARPLAPPSGALVSLRQGAAAGKGGRGSGSSRVSSVVDGGWWW